MPTGEIDGRYVRSVTAAPGLDPDPRVWPASVPAVAQVFRDGPAGRLGAGPAVQHPGERTRHRHRAGGGTRDPAALVLLPAGRHHAPALLLPGGEPLGPGEPDAPLSFTSCLGLAALLHDLAAAGSQLQVASHSPILAAIPGAHLLELGSWGIRPATWDDLDLVVAWRQFLKAPRSYLRHLIDSGAAQA